jgi:hypothetical protein
MSKILILNFIFVICVVQLYAQVSFTAKSDFTTGTAPVSVAYGDINRDGKPDMVVANSTANTLSVFLNTTAPGDVTPTYSAKTDIAITVGSQPICVCVADINNDGNPDIIFCNQGINGVSIFINTTAAGATTPTFSGRRDFATGNTPRGVTICDINGDGKPDVVTANYVAGGISVLMSTTNPGNAPSFAAHRDYQTGTGPWGITFKDINGDGKPDIITANNTAGTFSVILNTTIPGSASPSFSAKVDFTTGTNPISVSCEDLNGDGKPDLVVGYSGSNTYVSIFTNTTATGATTPAFSTTTDFPTTGDPYSTVIADLNGDGKPDLITANDASSTVSVLINNTTPGSTPSFLPKVDFTTGGNPRSVAIADFNGDYLPDIAVVNFSSNFVSVLLNTTIIGAAAPSLEMNWNDFPTGISPLSIGSADLNGDGKPDLVTLDYGYSTISSLLNTTTPGSNAFSFNSSNIIFTQSVYPRSLAIGNINGDGKPDLVVTSTGMPNIFVYMNTTAPGATTATFSTYTNFTCGLTPYAVAMGDFNKDGKQDLAIVNDADNTVSIYINATSPNATVPGFYTKVDFACGLTPRSVAVGDFNGDGKPDLAVGNESSNNVSIFINTTTPGSNIPTFSAATNFTTGTYPISIAVGDINGDGKPDLAIANTGSNTVSVFINTTVPGAAIPSFTAKTDYTTGLGLCYVCFGDLNGDLKPDIVTGDFDDYCNSVFINTTTAGAITPSFQARTEIYPNGQPYCMIIRDFNGDGKPDMALGNGSSAGVSLLLNDVNLPLPVELISFTANVFNSSVTLNWSTANEVNNFGFDIERCVNKIWQKIGFVPGNGNSNSPKEYSYVDRSPVPGGKISFRLKQIDNNGKFKYSDQIEVEIIPNNYSLRQNYPNPFNPSTTINYSIAKDGAVKLKVYNLIGEEVVTLVNEVKQAGNYNISFNASTLPSGIYFYKLESGNFVNSKKMILLK